MSEQSTAFAFTEVEIPARPAGPGRPAEVNPFLDRVADLVEADGTPRDVAVSFTLADGPDSVTANRIKRQLARAGIVHGVSVFKRIEEAPEGARVTFWAQDRIVPRRKPKDDSSAADQGGDVEGADTDASGLAPVTRLEP